MLCRTVCINEWRSILLVSFATTDNTQSSGHCYKINLVMQDRITLKGNDPLVVHYPAYYMPTY